MSNTLNLSSCSHHVMLLYNDYSDRELVSINYINQGLQEKQLCIYASIDAYDTSHLSKISQKINDYEENLIKRNLIMLNLKPFYDSALTGDLAPFDAFYIQSTTVSQDFSYARSGNYPLMFLHCDHFREYTHQHDCRTYLPSGQISFANRYSIIGWSHDHDRIADSYKLVGN